MKPLLKFLALFALAFSVAGAAGYLGVKAFTRSAPEMVLPDLVGKNIIEVLETLTQLGLNPKLHGTRFHETIPKYGVCFQDPDPGTTIKKGRNVVLYISKGVSEIQVPDLRRIALNQALLKLEATGLGPGRIVRVFDPMGLAETVMAQHPLPLARVPANTRCDLLVSRGPETVRRVMPNLEGLTLDKAVGLLKPLSLEVGEIRSGTDPARNLGQILGQAPLAGGPVPQSQKIQVLVNQAEPDQIMDPARLDRLTLMRFQVPEGFANRHVKVVSDLFDMETFLYNGYMKPGKIINLLIPGGIKTKIRIFIDHKLVQVKAIDPWQGEPLPVEEGPWRLNTGEFQWES